MLTHGRGRCQPRCFSTKTFATLCGQMGRTDQQGLLGPHFVVEGEGEVANDLEACLKGTSDGHGLEILQWWMAGVAPLGCFSSATLQDPVVTSVDPHAQSAESLVGPLPPFFT